MSYNFKIIIFLFFIFSNNAYSNEQNINDKPYKMVKEYTASYDVFYNDENIGTIEKHFYKNEDGSYTFENYSNVSTYLGFLPVDDQRKETGVFNIDSKTRIYSPVEYNMIRTGTWLDFNMHISFDNTINVIYFDYKNSKNKKIKTGEVLDRASYEIKLQELATNGFRGNLEREIAYKNGFRTYNFKFEKEEYITLNNKTIRTLKFSDQRYNDSKKSSVSWLDPNNNYVISKFEFKNGYNKNLIAILSKYKEVN